MVEDGVLEFRDDIYGYDKLQRESINSHPIFRIAYTYTILIALKSSIK